MTFDFIQQYGMTQSVVAGASGGDYSNHPQSETVLINQPHSSKYIVKL